MKYLELATSEQIKVEAEGLHDQGLGGYCLLDDTFCLRIDFKSLEICGDSFAEHCECN